MPVDPGLVARASPNGVGPTVLLKVTKGDFDDGGQMGGLVIPLTYEAGVLTSR